jgi:ribosomal RNA-processing protein 9
MMSGLRRKAVSTSVGPGKRVKKTVNLAWNDENDEIDSDNEAFDDQHGGASSDSEEEETVDAKKVRLAREYLEKIEAQDDESSSSEEEEEESSEYDRVGRKLQRDRLKRQGMYERTVAKTVANDIALMQKDIYVQAPATAQEEAKEWVASGNVKYLRGHDLTPTCVALQANGERALSGSKDNSVILWDVENCKRITNVCNQWKSTDMEDPRGNGEVLSIACSDDGRYAAIGRRDATVSIFDVRLSGKKQSTSLVTLFKGHKGPVTSLSFRTQSLQLFSGSEDRCIRHYNLEQMAYIETLYGHQAAVTDIDCHLKERPISVSMDRTARAWKLAEDTHLIYRGSSKVSWADCVSLVKDDWFVTGHQDGNLCLWMTEKKKAVETVGFAHGQNGAVARGIHSICGFKGSDLVATGSNDGYLRLWKTLTGSTKEDRGIEALSRVPLHGFINDIAIGPKARFCVAAVGQEPRLGRWDRVSKAKNRFGIIQLRCDESESDEDDSSQDEGSSGGGKEHSDESD